MTTGIPPDRKRFSPQPIVSSAVILVAWELIGHLMAVRPDVIPTPSRVFLEGWRNGPYLFEHLRHTASASIAGLLGALVITAAAFLVCGSSRQLCDALKGITDAWLALPAIAAAPVLVHWFGYGAAPRTVLVALVALPILGTGILGGLRRIPAGMLELMRSMHATPAQVMWELRAPFVLPPLLRSLRFAATAGVAAALGTEFVQSEAGLGFLMLSAMSKMNTPLVFAGMLSALALAALLVGIVAGVERICVRRHFD